MDGTRRRRRDAGAALLLFVAACVVMATAMLAGRLSAGGVRQLMDRRTAAALAEARAALIGYAASDPNRPGELPCPDFDGDGRVTVAQDYRGTHCRTLTGWLPTYTLRLEDLRDGAGERLWYAVTDEYRAGAPTPLSSETPGRLSLDGRADVVAVLFAPGEALEGQARGRGTSADLAIGDHLEGGSAAPGARDFLTGGAATNDRALAITRADLMAAVEQRVLSEVGRALAEYARWTDRGDGGAFPWPLPFGTDPACDGAGETPARQGLLPVHVPGAWFATDFVVDSWEFAGGTVLPGRGGPGTVDSGVLSRGGGQRVKGSAGTGRCAWSSLGTVACRGEAVETCAGAGAVCALPPGVARRVWELDLVFTGTATVHPATAARHATRDVSVVSGAVTAGEGPLLRVTDYDSAGGERGSGELWADGGGCVGTVQVSGIRLYPALPEWYAKNGWDHQTYLALSAGAAPGVVPAALPGVEPAPGVAAGRRCRAGVDCLTLRDGTGLPLRDDVPALVLAAGPPLPGQERDPAATGAAGSTPGGLRAYLEGDNANGDDVFTLAAPGPRCNDRLRVLEVAP